MVNRNQNHQLTEGRTQNHTKNQGLKKKRRRRNLLNDALLCSQCSVGLAHTLAATAWSVRLFVCCLKHRGKLDKLGLDYFYNHMDCNCTGYALASGLCDMNDIVDDISTARSCVGHQVPGGTIQLHKKKKRDASFPRPRPLAPHACG